MSTAASHAPSRSHARVRGCGAALVLVLAPVLAAWGADTPPPDAPMLKLERVVIVQRHGVRSPTQKPDVLKSWAAQDWPAWKVAPGQLTRHGGEVVLRVASTIGDHYRRAGLIPASCAPAKAATRVWADGKDQRTRQSGRFLARGLMPACGDTAPVAFRQDNDPIFDSLAGDCRMDPAEAKAAALAALGSQELIDPPTRRAIDAIQQAMAPAACSGGPGLCLSGPSSVSAAADRIVIDGPLPVASEAAEIFLLQYAQRMPLASVAWGHGNSLEQVQAFMAAHERADSITRALDYVAVRRGARMAQLILDTLEGKPQARQPRVGADTRVLALAGHDTNLSNMAGVFGLRWQLESQPDSTAPATALSFELWRDKRTGTAYVQPRIFFLTLPQMRELAPPVARMTALSFGRCTQPGPDGMCPLRELSRAVDEATPAACRRPATMLSRQ